MDKSKNEDLKRILEIYQELADIIGPEEQFNDILSGLNYAVNQKFQEQIPIIIDVIKYDIDRKPIGAFYIQPLYVRSRNSLLNGDVFSETSYRPMFKAVFKSKDKEGKPTVYYEVDWQHNKLIDAGEIFFSRDECEAECKRREDALPKALAPFAPEFLK